MKKTTMLALQKWISFDVQRKLVNEDPTSEG